MRSLTLGGSSSVVRLVCFSQLTGKYMVLMSIAFFVPPKNPNFSRPSHPFFVCQAPCPLLRAWQKRRMSLRRGEKKLRSGRMLTRQPEFMRGCLGLHQKNVFVREIVR